MSLARLNQPPLILAFTQKQTEPVDSEELLEIIGRLLSSFNEAMQPVALELRTSCVRDEDEGPVRDQDEAQPYPAWCLRQEPPPPGVLVGSDVGATAIMRAEEIDRPAVHELLVQAMDQERCIIGWRWVLRDLRITASLARICDPEAQRRGVLRADDGGAIHEFELLTDRYGVWLGGPGPLLDAPPLSLCLIQESASLGLVIGIAASPWSTPGHPEHELLARCLRRLLPAWSLKGLDHGFELEPDDRPGSGSGGRGGVRIDESAFIRAIVAAPADRGPRLVYADWLEERGDPRAEYLRLLCAAADGGSRPGDPLHQLGDLRPALDSKWVELMHQGIRQGGLEYQPVYDLHCEVRLDAGPVVKLRALNQQMTYAGLLAGTPTRRSNNDWIERTMANAQRAAAGGRAHLIDPPRRNYQMRPGDMRWVARDDHVPEWLPAVTCIGLFGDALSDLAVVWFQGELAPPIREPVMNEIRKLDWGALATHWDAGDL